MTKHTLKILLCEHPKAIKDTLNVFNDFKNKQKMY